MKASSVKGVSENKPKTMLNLGESMYAASINSQGVASPVASDNFNKEIMMKLLNIL